MSKFLDICTKMSLFAFVMFSPINWISIVNVGGLSIKYMHLAIVPIVICLFFASFRHVLAKIIHEYSFILSCFMLLMVMNFISTCFNSVVYPTASSYILKNFFYCCYFMLFAGVMYFRMQKPSFYKDITYSNIFSVLVFVATATVIFKAIGRDFLGEMLGFFLKGDSMSLKFDLYKVLFNADSSGDMEIATNLRNTLMGAFIYIHFSSLYANMNLENKKLRLINLVCILFTGFFILASVSRSNILVLILGYFIYFMCEIIINRNSKKFSQLIVGGVVLLTLSLIFWDKIENVFSSSTTMIAGRLGEMENDIRWKLNAEAMTGFSRNFLLGKGSGAILSDGYLVHNFIIGSAYQAGIMGLVLSTLFYFGIVAYLFKTLRPISKYRGAFFITSLLIIPLLRSMESGNVGSLSLVEWFCMAIFFSFIMHIKYGTGIFTEDELKAGLSQRRYPKYPRLRKDDILKRSGA